MSRVYLDNAATTPISEVALQAFIEQSRQLGNPSSLHTYGRKVRKDVEEAREKLAGLIGCHSSEIIFTGSGTEANNLAIKGAYWHRNQGGKQRNVIVISAFEHHAVLDPARWLEDFEGAELVEIPVTREGFINLAELRNVVLERHDEIALISIMHSNNEVGTVQPMEDISKIAQEFKIPLHTDAVQSLGKVPLSFKELGLFAMTISAHKVGGPIGVGALILQKGIDITPILHGGGQERDIRSGTLNAAGIIAFVAATQSAMRDLESNAVKISALRKKLVAAIQAEISDATLNGVLEGATLPGIANISFPNTESDALLLLFDAEGIACSTGSACSAGVQEASHVLMAMGLSEKEARSSLRFSLGTGNSDSDIEYLQTCIKRVIDRARAAYRG
ncbi:MAG TPA: cysteine desulfurase family protein [Candidatus Nanopelagicaceae bacterium]|nr:cysteine desulfurase family protein [Candidatus Nanopelagicaceae bacterium]